MTDSNIHKILEAWEPVYRDYLAFDSVGGNWGEDERSIPGVWLTIQAALERGDPGAIQGVRELLERAGKLTPELAGLLKQQSSERPTFPEWPAKPSDETHWLKWYHSPVIMPDGKQPPWGFVHCRPAVAIVAFDAERRVALVRQFRYPAQRQMVEIPKGFVEDGESPEQAATRELREEVGVVAGQMDSADVFLAAPGIGLIEHHIFLAQDLVKTSELLDQEIEELEWVSLEEFAKRVADGKITDAVTIASVAKERWKLNNKGNRL